ncbi:DUF4126 domain-containing protein [Chroococcus sp. FPU101]|uniref:DUF4126 domain-containing protein n=1 Tax=Chroococcus sp. FPU101 TaxID=1974212 RepID=UPI001A8F8B5C|nr:DUF4126 domain-containing protein [Chroococcus sp. FPU101]
MVTGILAVLSASAAAGLRSALPLLVVSLIHSELWLNIPLLSRFHPQVVFSILISWSLFELFGSKNLLGQWVLQLIQLAFSPLVGVLMSLTIARIINLPVQVIWILGIVGGSLAFVIQLVQMGWFFRLRGIPIWATFLVDFLCVILVEFSLNAPEKGGLIALLLLWLVIRSASEWRRWINSERTADKYQQFL